MTGDGRGASSPLSRSGWCTVELALSWLTGGESSGELWFEMKLRDADREGDRETTDGGRRQKKNSLNRVDIPSLWSV